MNIMSNEIIRRMEVTSADLCTQEKIKIIDKFTQQLVNSDYNWKQCHDIVISGLKGWLRKVEKNKRTNKPRYRSGLGSLKYRTENVY